MQLAIELSDEQLRTITERVAELLTSRQPPEPEQWIGVEQAAEHLACPKSRIYALVSAGRIPHERDGSRLLFRRSELDEWTRNGGAKRP